MTMWSSSRSAASSPTEYRTHDFPLTVFLQSQGHTPRVVPENGYICAFIFPMSEALQLAVQAYASGAVKVQPGAYEGARSTLKRAIKQARFQRAAGK